MPSSHGRIYLFYLAFTWQLAAKLKDGRNRGAFDVHQNKIKVHGTNANVTHTINDDERTEFTRHINGVLAGDAHIGNRLPIPTNTMQLFDECKGKKKKKGYSCGKYEYSFLFYLS